MQIALALAEALDGGGQVHGLGVGPGGLGRRDLERTARQPQQEVLERAGQLLERHARARGARGGDVVRGPLHRHDALEHAASIVGGEDMLHPVIPLRGVEQAQRPAAEHAKIVGELVGGGGHELHRREKPLLRRPIERRQVLRRAADAAPHRKHHRAQLLEPLVQLVDAQRCLLHVSR